MPKIDIKAAVQPGMKVKFDFYRDGKFWYNTEQGDVFPVPIEDVGSAVLLSEDKAILFMRYMRKWNESIGDQDGEL